MDILAFSILSFCVAVLCFGLGMLLQQSISEIHSNMANLNLRLSIIEQNLSENRGQNVGNQTEISKKILPREETTDPDLEWSE